MEFKSFKAYISLGLTWSPDGSKLAILNNTESVRILDSVSGRECHTLEGDEGAVLCVAWSPDGTKLASCSENGGVRLWDALTGEQVSTLRGVAEDEDEEEALYETKNYGPIQSIDWSLDGTKLAVDRSGPTCPVKIVRGWDVANGQKLQALKEEDFPEVYSKEICELDGIQGELVDWTWSPDGKQFVSVDEEENEDSYICSLRVWDASSGKELYRLDEDYQERCVWSPDGMKLASFSEHRNDDYELLRVWDASSGKELYKLDGHKNGVGDCSWSKDGTKLASGGGDGTVKIWDALSGDKLHTLIEHTGEVQWVTWSPDGNMLASGSPGEVKIWDASCARSSLQTLVGVTSPAWSPDGTKLAAGEDGVFIPDVVVWDTATWEELSTLVEEEGGYPEVANEDREARQLFCIAWSPDGGLLAIGSGDYYFCGDISNFSVRVLKASCGEEVGRFKGHEGSVHGVVWSPDGTRIASCSADKTIRLWDPFSGTELDKLVGHGDVIRSVAWSPDGKKLVSGSEDALVKTWDASNGSELQTLKGHIGGVRGVAWSPDGKIIASGSWDDTVKLWDPSDGSEIETLKGHKDGIQSVAWSPDGKSLASDSKGEIIIWSVPK